MSRPRALHKAASSNGFPTWASKPSRIVRAHGHARPVSLNGVTPHMLDQHGAVQVRHGKIGQYQVWAGGVQLSEGVGAVDGEKEAGAKAFHQQAHGIPNVRVIL